jgi:DNA-binding CsgD family transcriptional regulator
MPAEILDAVYEAVVDPSLWAKVLGQISEQIEVAGGALMALDGREVRWVASEGSYELIETVVAGGWMEPGKNARAPKLQAMHYPGFVEERDVYSLEELDHLPMYTELLRPMGFGWAAGTLVNAASGDLLVFNFERRFTDGPVPRSAIRYLDDLRPHLARSSLLSSLLHLREAKVAVETLERVGMPAAVLSRSGRLLAGNNLIQSMIPAALQDHRDRLHFSSRNADRRLEEILAAGPEAGGGSVPVAGEAGTQPLVLHFLPIAGAAHDVFRSSGWLLLMTAISRPGPTKSHTVGTLFDLTPAEARIATVFIDGGSPQEIAEGLGTSVETVRTHLKSILQKTGTHRQSELMRLLVGIVSRLPDITGGGT